MRNKAIFFFVIVIACFSCRSHLQVKQELDLFEKDMVGNFYLFKKKGFKLKNEDSSTAETRYSIKTSKDLKSYSCEISEIPNKIIFEFEGKQKIIIFGNANKVQMTNDLKLNKELFKERLKYLKIAISSIDDELSILKENTFNGINIMDDHIILYLNVPKEKVALFDESVLSFQYLE